MDEHPISLEKAKELIAGDLGDVYRKILSDCCVPIFWYRLGGLKSEFAHNGTLTIVRTPKKTIGITAAHVIRQFADDIKHRQCKLQLMNVVVGDLLDRVIDISDKYDIVTVELDEGIVQKLEKVPLNMWPPMVPQEGRGIMIAGFPGVERLRLDTHKVSWGLFTVIGVARTVSQEQITWLVEPELHIPHPKIPTPPAYFGRS